MKQYSSIYVDRLVSYKPPIGEHLGELINQAHFGWTHTRMMPIDQMEERLVTDCQLGHNLTLVYTCLFNLSGTGGLENIQT